jgi:hypothetical protein
MWFELEISAVFFMTRQLLLDSLCFGLLMTSTHVPGYSVLYVAAHWKTSHTLNWFNVLDLGL